MKIIFAAALLWASSLSAQETAEAEQFYDAESKSDEELKAKVGDKDDPWLERPCELGVPLFGELARRLPENPFFIRGELLSGAFCDDVEGEYEAGLVKLKQLENHWPENDFSNLGFYFAFRSNDATEYLSRLRALDDKQLSEFDPERFWQGARMINTQGASDAFDDLMLEWIDSRRLSILPADLQGGVSRNALEAAIRQGRTDMAPQLLATIRYPSTYVDLLASRKYEPVWPLVAERAGPHLDRITDEYAFWALGRLENHSEDRDRFSDAAHALHFAGRFEEAIALAQQWREREGAMESIEEGDGWALNIEAYANDALGRRKKADAIFDQLAELDPEEHPWVVNFVINRASRLVGQERWEEGLEAAGLARTVAAKWGSPYARMIVARDHVCALMALGRSDEIAPDLAYLRENAAEFYPLAAQALQCAGAPGEATALLLEGIRDERYRAGVVSALQPSAFDLFYTPSQLPEQRDLLDTSAELRAAFERYARLVPEEFIPTASIRAKR